MTPRLFLGLAVAAIVSLMAAAGFHASKNRWNTGGISGAPVLPELESRANDVAQIRIRKGEQTLTLERKGEAWSLKERDGFPARTDKANALIVQLAKARKVERKTASKDKFAVLELGDPAEKDAKSHLVTLLDAKGGVIAETIVGKKRFDAFGSDRPGMYVRSPAQEQSWLADGAIDVSTDVSAWIDRAVVKLGDDKVKTLKLEVEGEAPVEVRQKAGSDGKSDGFEYAAIPEGQKAKLGVTAGSLLLPYTTIEADDLRRPQPAATDAKTSKATLTTDAGLAMTLTAHRAKDDAWLTIEASGDGKAKEAADAITARTKGWQFKIPAGTADALFKKRADIFEPAEPKKPGG